MMQAFSPAHPVPLPPEPVLPGLSPALVELLIQAAAPQRLALVGGAVRDLLRHRLHDDPWTGLPDLDLVVEGETDLRPLPPGSRDVIVRAQETGRSVVPASSAQPATAVPAAAIAAMEPSGLDRSGDAQEQGRETAPAAHRLGRRLRERLGAAAVPFYQEHPAYGTVELEVLLAAGPLLLDVATARRETYPQPGRNPQVRYARLEDDLARRDFTVNAMALVLHGSGSTPIAAGPAPNNPAGNNPEADNPERNDVEACPTGGAGTPGSEAARRERGGAQGDGSIRGLLDPYGGQHDLQRRQLRFLHDGSIRDDPTRVLRGARYAARMGFELATPCRQQLLSTLAEWPWPWRPGDPPGSAPPALGTRLRVELELLLEREPWPQGLAALQRWGALSLLDPALQQDRHWRQRLHWAGRFGLPLLPALLAVLSDPLPLAERLQLPHRQHRLLAGYVQLCRRLAQLPDPRSAARCRDPGFWTELLEEPGHGAEAVALALAANVGPRRPLLRWWLHWRHLGAEVSATSLIAAGLRPGPELGERLRQSRLLRLRRQRL